LHLKEAAAVEEPALVISTLELAAAVDAMLQEPPLALQKLAQIQSPLVSAVLAAPVEVQLLALEYRHRKEETVPILTIVAQAEGEEIMYALSQQA
jgi:hypothetical protein